MSVTTGVSENAHLRIKDRHKMLPSKASSFRDKLFRYTAILLLLVYTFIIIFGEVLLLPPDKAKWCKYSNNVNPKEYENPDYNTDLCRYQKTVYLLYLTVDECDYARRMLVSVIYGAIIGLERRSADRPAGIRTMSLVSLGSCFFTMCGMNAFRSSTMGWDAARVSAAIPSGVGFLGAGLIWKSSTDKGSSSERHQVHGLATAAGVWLSAAIGVGVGGKLYVPSTYAVMLVIFLLRLGPNFHIWDDSSQGNVTSLWSSDNLAGWDSDQSNLDEGIDEMDDGNNSDDMSLAVGTGHNQGSKRKFVSQEEQMWLLERENGFSPDSETEIAANVSKEAVYETVLTTDRGQGESSQRKVYANQSRSLSNLSELGGDDHQAMTEQDTMRRIKSEAEFSETLRDNRKSKTRRRSSRRSNKGYPIYFS